MKSTLNITQAQTCLSSIVRAEQVVGITKDHQVRGFYVPRARLESILETLELLSDPKAMKALRTAGQGKYVGLAEARKEWGL